MENAKKITVVYDNAFFDHRFGYLPQTDIDDILARLLNKKSCVAEFRNGEQAFFTAVFDFEDGKIHVRELVGRAGMDFKTAYKALDAVACGMAMFAECGVVSFGQAVRGKKAIQLANDMGYMLFAGEMVKRVRV